MKGLLLITGILLLSACATKPILPVETHTYHSSKYHLTGGVLEPTYPPDGPINCWIQPGTDSYWYPCPQKSDAELGLHGH